MKLTNQVETNVRWRALDAHSDFPKPVKAIIIAQIFRPKLRSAFTSNENERARHYIRVNIPLIVPVHIAC